MNTPLSQSIAYVIKDKRLELDIAVLNVDSLHLHEETIPDLLVHLTQSIESDGLVKHPIIVDRESLVVLDGVHRVSALKKLSIRRVPACLIDYENPRIRVCSWYRTITNLSTPENLLSLIRKAGATTEKIENVDEDTIGISPTVAAVKFRYQTFLVKSPYRNLVEAYNIIGALEAELRVKGMRVRYETEGDALEDLRNKRVRAVILMPRLSKREIIDAALSGQFFASKATRHVIPARIMNLNVPLTLLRDLKKPLSRVNEKLGLMLKRRRLKRIPPSSIFDGRRYEEELYVFEE